MKYKRLISLLLASALLFAMAPASFAINDSMETAVSITPGEAVSADLESGTYYWYRFEVAAGQFIKLSGFDFDYDYCRFYTSSSSQLPDGWSGGIYCAMAETTGIYFLRVKVGKSKPVTFTIDLLDNDQYECNNTLSTAVALEMDKDYTIITSYLDDEWFSVSTEPGQILTVTADTHILFYDSEEEELDYYSSGNQDWCFVPPSGTVYIRPYCDRIYDLIPTTVSFSATVLNNDDFEYNNTEETAYALTSGVPVEFQLGYSDIDYFIIETTKAGQDVQIDFSGFNYTTTTDYFYAHFDDVQIGTIDGNGTYYLHAANAGKHIIKLYNGGTTELFTMTATVLDGDTNEPNDTLEQATRLPIGTDKTFSMGGQCDEDWFTFESVFGEGADSQLYTLNLLDLNTDYSDEFYYDLYAPDGTELMSGAKVNIRHINLIACEQEGLYALRLYRTSNSSPRSDLRIRVDEGGADPYEPNDTWLTAVEIQAEQPVQFILSNTEDVDWFKFEVPEAYMTMHFNCDSTVNAALYSAEGLEEHGVTNAFRIGLGYYQFMTPGTYYIRLTSSQSYITQDLRTLTISLEEARDNEPNNSWKTATPIFEGVPMVYDLTAFNDDDWAVFEIPEGVKTLQISGDHSGYRYLYREKDFETAGNDAAHIEYSYGNRDITVNSPRAGNYYLRCTDGRLMDQTVVYYLYMEDIPAQSIEDAEPIAEGQWIEEVRGGYYALGELKAADEIRIYSDNVSYVRLYDAEGVQQWQYNMQYSQNVCKSIPSDGEFWLEVTPYTTYKDDNSYRSYSFLYDIADREPEEGETFVIEGPDSITVAVGDTAEVDLRLAPYDAKCDRSGGLWDYTSPANTTITTAGSAYVQGYYVTGKTVGSTTIKYYLSGHSSSVYKIITINVVDPTAAQSITIEDAPTELPLSTAVTLQATLTPADANDSIVWSSSDPKVLYVNESGKVTAIGDGSATITATAASGVSDSVTITVTDAPAKPVVTGLTLDDYDLTLYMGEGDGQLTATVSPAGSPVAVSWVSSNLKAATVDQNGKITPVAPGVTVITASAGDYRASCIVTVQPDRVNVESIAFDTAVLEIPLGGESVLRPAFTPSDATVKSMTWASSDTNVASVSRTGIVNALAVGETTITATTLDGGKQASIIVRVTAAPQPGDINGDGYVDAADAMITLQVAVGKVELNDAEFEAADVNHDGWVDAADAVRILRYDAGLIDSLDN